MPVKRKSRTLSEVGCELFKSVNMFAPSDKLNRMNSWSDIHLLHLQVTKIEEQALVVWVIIILI